MAFSFQVRVILWGSFSILVNPTQNRGPYFLQHADWTLIWSHLWECFHQFVALAHWAWNCRWGDNRYWHRKYSLTPAKAGGCRTSNTTEKESFFFSSQHQLMGSYAIWQLSRRRSSCTRRTVVLTVSCQQLVLLVLRQSHQQTATCRLRRPEVSKLQKATKSDNQPLQASGLPSCERAQGGGCHVMRRISGRSCPSEL